MDPFLDHFNGFNLRNADLRFATVRKPILLLAIPIACNSDKTTNISGVTGRNWFGFFKILQFRSIFL